MKLNATFSKHLSRQIGKIILFIKKLLTFQEEKNDTFEIKTRNFSSTFESFEIIVEIKKGYTLKNAKDNQYKCKNLKLFRNWTCLKFVNIFKKDNWK